MNKKLLVLLVLCISTSVFSQKIKTSKEKIVFSAIKGTLSKVDSIILKTDQKEVKIGSIRIKGEHASFFKVISPKLNTLTSKTPQKIGVVFQPEKDFIGIAHASLQIKNSSVRIPLTGLSTKGLEGENESPLSEVIEALGYKIDIGWKTLAHHWKPELQGEE